MHEASLVTSLLRQVDELVVGNGGGQVAEIRIEVGLLAGVESVLLSEVFRRLRVGTVAADAELIVDAVGLTCRCRACQLGYVIDELRFVCPTCGGGDVDVTAGDTVVLHSFTLAQPAEATTSR